MTIDERIDEIKRLIFTVLKLDLEKGTDDTQNIVPKLTNNLVQLYREKNGFTGFDGKLKDE